MKKKVILTIAAATALLMTNPNDSLANSEKTDTHFKVYHQQYVVPGSNFSQEDFEKHAQQYIKMFEQKYQTKFQTQQPERNQQPKQQIQQPSQQQPVQQQPAQQTEQPKQPESQQAQSSLSQYEIKVVELTNAERAKHGLAPLSMDEQLSQVARQKSLDMKQNNYFSHQSPTYGSPFDMMQQFGVNYRSAGENIAMGQRSPEEVVNAWMNSDGHRKNILSSSFTHIGVGHVAEGNYWTQMFIGK
ncbi:CAP domain-containing protein [Alkalihalobacterium alkalinitrilicum]|uniref:CAP domain-containing protein n=1 Tax=Alkalihalobacterium alkalinitrilicum TaxID=427920 RepID=UPI000994E7F4|nr:CAP domain-containing protein [Alkalihalobacterium alkalinitrilicum]